MSFRAAIFALPVALLGCPSKNPPAAASDASVPDSAAVTVSVDAGPTVAPVDKTLGVVAEGAATMSLQILDDTRTGIVAGGIPYEGRPDGTLAPIIPYEGLAPFYPDDDVFVGYSGSSLTAQKIHGPFDGKLVLSGWRDSAVLATLAGGKVTSSAPVATNVVERFAGRLIGFDWSGNARHFVWLDDPKAPIPALPKEMDNVSEIATSADGSLVAVGISPGGPLRAAVYAATWKEGDKPVTFTGPAASNCTRVPAADKSFVLRCSNWSATSTLLRVTTKAFEPLLADAPRNVSAAAIGNDGAVYLAVGSTLEVQRCPLPKGECSTIPIAKDVAKPRAAHYEQYSADVVDESGHSWFYLRVDGARKEDGMTSVFAIAAHDEHDVWVAARTNARSLLLHAGAPKNPTVLPGPTDGRVLVRNTKAPQVWTGHCDQVFVKLGKSDGAAWAKRAPEIQKALGAEANAYENAFQWSLVEGRLHDQHVVGVLVVRRDVEEKQEKMEAAINKMIVAMTPDPMSTPPAYCTLPVLEQKLFPSD